MIGSMTLIHLLRSDAGWVFFLSFLFCRGLDSIKNCWMRRSLREILVQLESFHCSTRKSFKEAQLAKIISKYFLSIKLFQRPISSRSLKSIFISGVFRGNLWEQFSPFSSARSSSHRINHWWEKMFSPLSLSVKAHSTGYKNRHGFSGVEFVLELLLDESKA